MAEQAQALTCEVTEPLEQPAGPEARRPIDRLGLSASMLALAACGGGGGGGGTPPPPSAPAPPTPPPPPVIILPTRAESSRFLAQATMGSSRADIEQVMAIGFEAWLDGQFAMARPISHWDWLIQAGVANDPNNMNNQLGFDNAMWRQLIASPDQLRQRVGMALLDFLVVGIDGVNSPWRQFTVAAFVDVLMDNAFGNFRTLIERISTNAAMGYYLTFLGNRRANAQTGAVPDENYAREVMQLFTIGLLRLNQDGTLQLNNGQQVETYGQDDITGLARVFTGYVLAAGDNATPDRFRQPMAIQASQHETGEKTFLGTTIPPGTNAADSLRMALDTIFNHPNVAPFVSKQLIQRLVTSNPPPSYVARIAAVFANNGAGVRGDLRAVVRAILLDVEARNAAIAGASSFGKLRAPVNRLTAWSRAFGAISNNGSWAVPGNTTSTSNRLGQSPGRSPSVFNFFRPGYVPPNSPISAANLVAPEFQITNEPSVIAYVNYLQSLVISTGDFRANYTDILTRADNSTSLVDEVDFLLGARLSDATKATIRGAVDAIAIGSTNGPTNRVHTAILLTLASPEFLVQK
ncbi:MAG: DUF1800 domain-containing protein [Sphingosinicella sp.]